MAFHSKDLSLTFEFHSLGTIRGRLTSLRADSYGVTTNFSGFYTEVSEGFQLSFMAEWGCNKEILSAYSGVIFQYELRKQCLVLKYLNIDETSFNTRIHRDFILLFDSDGADYTAKEEVVLSKIPMPNL